MLLRTMNTNPNLENEQFDDFNKNNPEDVPYLKNI